MTGMSLEELDREHAEYLPDREVMWCYRGTDSDPFRTPIPIESVQRFRRFRTPR